MGSPVGEVSYTYDAANRLTSVGGVSYTWDDNGNLTSDGVLSYTYDHANRLTQVTEGSLTTQFAYNGDGVRASKTTGGDTTQYVLDIIAQQRSERLHYVHDGLRSVRQLLNTTSEVEGEFSN